MSKKKGHAHKRRKRLKSQLKAVRCVTCHAKLEESPTRHLSALADLLNLAEQAKDKRLKIRFRHGAAFSEVGVLLPPYKSRPWEVKEFNLSGPAPTAADVDGDGPDD